MMPGRGTEARNRTKLVGVRLSEDEFERIARKARDAGDVRAAEYLRAAALGREPSSIANVIAELRRLGALQKHLYDGDGVHRREYAEVLLELTDAIRRVAALGKV